MAYQLSSIIFKTENEMRQALAAISVEETALDFSWNEFHEKTVDELLRLFTAIPVWIRTLGLSLNDRIMSQSPGNGLMQVMKSDV